MSQRKAADLGRVVARTSQAVEAAREDLRTAQTAHRAALAALRAHHGEALA